MGAKSSKYKLANFKAHQIYGKRFKFWNSVYLHVFASYKYVCVFKDTFLRRNYLVEIHKK